MSCCLGRYSRRPSARFYCCGGASWYGLPVGRPWLTRGGGTLVAAAPDMPVQGLYARPRPPTCRNRPCYFVSSAHHTGYLVLYNVAAIALWLWADLLCLQAWATGEHAEMWDHIEFPLKLAQTMAVLEVVHAAAGWVRSNPATAALQCASPSGSSAPRAHPNGRRCHIYPACCSRRAPLRAVAHFGCLRRRSGALVLPAHGDQVRPTLVLHGPALTPQIFPQPRPLPLLRFSWALVEAPRYLFYLLKLLHLPVPFP